jgi:crotonobetainyl-CoA:carnitine CoA-transferase CaiB-like acyl-CoA transferase
VPFVVIDMSTALYAFQVLSAALYARRDEARGRRLEISLLQAASAVQVIRMMMVYLEGDRVRRAMPSGVFKTADGWLQMLIVREAQWVALCGVLGAPDLAADPRFATDQDRSRNEAALMAILRPAIAERTTEYWATRLHEADIMHQRLSTFREFLRQPQAEAINLISWLDLAGVPEPLPVPNIAGLAPFGAEGPKCVTPVNGQHTREVLAEHGFSGDAIEALLARGVVGVPA